ncbi:hypothetical protein BGW36DRAFT_457673 [Talaromyces proteolyticus]|uniref:AB hydrolase-1 domain-containing protein n=1 Tax=Talaromyces proteolyticus TaxID=1131652 RepID=A0AAD4Q4R1_9EURO|nr:uncharacterized protein BGW36DRAFT_457673 [Talaromyces proteolyticus]KAH8703384.1 hypothetical protein BGW36DRAFT_457673 [Talaromyces proteolyticus]
MAESVRVELVQSLPTSGARAVASFCLQGHQYLAIPQLAQDIPGGEAGMNLGDSNAPLLIYRADSRSDFRLFQELPVPGGEDAEFFSINDRYFLATASLRSGKGPYNLDVKSVIFEWNGLCFEKFQEIPTFAAKQWRYFSIAGRHFLALAQGVEIPGVVATVPSDSTIFEWDGSIFNEFQTVPSKWGYNWLQFSVDQQQFLAYADHIAGSILLKWDGSSFVHFQNFEGIHGRAFCFFSDEDGTAYLAFSRISSDSLLYRWNGESFVNHQCLEGAGGREFTLVRTEQNLYLVHVKFIIGGRSNPNPALDSVIYQVEKDGLKVVSTFPTLGATDVMALSRNDQLYMVVTESLTAAQRFRTDTHIYHLVTGNTSHSRRDIINKKASYQSPEFLELFTAYTASNVSIGSQLTTTMAQQMSSYPLLVATSFDILLFPGNGKQPEYLNFRLGNRGFKELAAISHLGPALGSLVQMHEAGAARDSWQPHARRLLEKVIAVQKINSESLWRDLIQAESYKGRESSISSMIDYACAITRKYLELMLEDLNVLSAEFLRENYLEAVGDRLNATVPFNAIMIATFFLVGLDTSYRIRQWFENYDLDWQNGMVLITGRQGRETSGVTISTSSVAQMILQSSNLKLPVERLYIAPHGPVPDIKDATDIRTLRDYEPRFRKLWSGLYGMGQLGQTMFTAYPAFMPKQDSMPVIDSSTTTVSELPKISNPNDWFSMNTRMRVVLEDPRQLLSGCVADYAAEQLRLFRSDLSKVIVPGLDGVDYSSKLPIYKFLVREKAFTISSCPYPLGTDLPATIRTIKVNGGTLAYRENGPSNGQTVIWIHGLPLDSRSWAAQFDYFSDKYQNIFVDLRGYGSSSKLPSGITDITQLYCDDILALMNHLNISSAAMVGFASAGHVALRFSAQNPGRISKLVVLNGSPRFKRNATDYTFGFSDTQIQDHFLAAADSGGVEALADAILDPVVVFQDLNASDAEKVSSWFRVMCYNAGLDTLLGFFRGIVNDDDRHWVPFIRAPVLILSSSLGKEVPAQTAMYLRQHIQKSKLVEIPDADHFLHITRPVIVNQLIGGFLASASS